MLSILSNLWLRSCAYAVVILVVLLGTVCPAPLAAAVATLTTTTSVAVSPSSAASASTPVGLNTQLTVTATVKSTVGTPTGLVEFLIGNEHLDTVPLKSGVATYIGGFYFIGVASGGGQANQQITAHYLGNSTYKPSISNVVDAFVLGAAVAVEIRAAGLACNQQLSPIIYAAGYDGPTGTLTFTNDGETNPNVAKGTAIPTASNTVFTFDANHGIVLGYTGAVSASHNPQAAVTGFFSADQVSDILVASGANYLTYLYSPSQASLGSTKQIPTAGNAIALTLGDFNGDGSPDVAVLEPNQIEIFLGDGAGGFTSAGSTSYGGSLPTGIAAGDFDGDGNQDVAVADGAGTVYIFYGNGAGALTLAQTIAVGGSPQSVIAKDFNQDGLQDLAVANSTSNLIQIFLETGVAANPFPDTASSTMAVTAPVALASADFDNDGNYDLVSANGTPNVPTSYSITTFQGSATGTFTAGQTFAYTGNAAGYSGNNPSSPVGNEPSSVSILDPGRTGLGHPGFIVTFFGDTVSSPYDSSGSIYRANRLNTNLEIFYNSPTNAFANAFSPGGVGYGVGAGVVTTVPIVDRNQTDPSFYSINATTGILQNFNRNDSTTSASNPAIGYFSTPTYFTYSGDSEFPAIDTSTSSFFAVANPFNAGQITSNVVTVPTSAVQAQTVSLSASVTGAASAPTDGSVAFCIGNNFVGQTSTIASTSGNASVFTFNSTTLPIGTSPITAIYFGDTTSFHSSVSDVTSVAVTALPQATSIITLTSSPAATSGMVTAMTIAPARTAPVTFTATVPGATAGFVTFYNGESPLLTVPVSSAGVATLKTNEGPGRYTIRAVFNGSNVFTPSVASEVLLVQASSAAVMLTASGDPCDSYLLTANVASGGAPIGTVLGGDVTFTDTTTNTVIGTVPIIPNAASPSTFSALTKIPSGAAYPVSAISADFNNDGNIDLILSTSTNQYTFTGNGDGTFTPLTTGYNSASGMNFGLGGGATILTGYFNSDTTPDIALTASGYPSPVFTYLNDGTPYFTGADTKYPVILGDNQCTSADFNGDGLSDLFCATDGNGAQAAPPNPYIMLNQGGSTPGVLGYAAVPFTAPTDPGYGFVGSSGVSTQVLSADLNGDGKQDVIIRQNAGDATSANPANLIFVLLGNGDGTFTKASGSGFSSAGATPANANVGDMIVGDFNGDGKMDLIVNNWIVYAGANGTLQVFTGNGDGTFTSAATITEPANVQYKHIYAADVNGDGILDIVGIHCDGVGATCDSVDFLLGNGDGTFNTPINQPIFTGANSDFLNIADVNGDGLPDIMSINYGDDTISVQLNTTKVTPTGYATLAVPTTGLLNSDALYGHNITASYSGDSVNAAGGPSSAVVLAEETTSLTLSTSGTPSNFGQSVTFTATLGGLCTVSGSTAATGTVQFYVDGTATGAAVSVSSGVPTFSTTTLTPGSHAITVVYSGDNVYGTSTANALTQVVQQTTTTTLTSVPNPSVVAQSVTFTATVANESTGSTGTPTGTVNFIENGATIGTGTIDAKTSVFPSLFQTNPGKAEQP